MVKQEDLKGHEWTQEELDDHRLALTKDTFCMAALLLILVRASRLMEYCEMPEVTTLEIIWALVAFAVVSFVLACHLVVLPPPVEKEQRAAIIAFAFSRFKATYDSRSKAIISEDKIKTI